MLDNDAPSSHQISHQPIVPAYVFYTSPGCRSDRIIAIYRATDIAHMITDYQSPLSSRYAVDIITLIYENGRIMATDMLRIAKNYKTVIKTADMLVEDGILEMHLESGKRLMKIYELTPKGTAIGKRLFECREIFYDRIPCDTEEEAPAETKEKKSKKKSKN